MQLLEIKGKKDLNLYGRRPILLNISIETIQSYIVNIFKKIIEDEEEVKDYLLNKLAVFTPFRNRVGLVVRQW